MNAPAENMLNRLMQPAFFKLVLVCYFTVPGSARENMEAVIKAGYLQKVIKFIEWPGDYQNMAASDSFYSGVFGGNRFADAIGRSYKDAAMHEKKVEIYRFSAVEELKYCHVLIIAADYKQNLRGILNFTANKPILTISGCENFAEMGGIINFIKHDNTISFQINETKAYKASLEVDFRLFHEGEIVQPLNK